MLKAITASTSEIDDVELAVSEILEQLDINHSLLRNSVGFVSCFSEFLDSGVIQALQDALPFDIVGTTTLLSGIPNDAGIMILTLMVLTSDDVEFALGLTDEILGPDDAPINKAYTEATAGRTEKPAMILSFVPLLLNVGGDFFVDTLNKLSGGIPNFGTLAVDHNDDYHESRVICNGNGYANQYAFVLLYGDVQPRFYMRAIDSEKVFHDKGVVTASQGNQLQTVNHIPVADYLQTLGLTKNPDGTITGINAFPFICDYNDGTVPVVRVMFALTPEGYAVCGGNVPVGAILSMGSIDGDQVVTSTKEMLEEIVSQGPYQCLLIFSCVGRYFSLGHSTDREREAVANALDHTDILYQMTYAGGELCPVYQQTGGASLTNRNHNDTIIICAL
jgi:hypothetical protein